MLHIMSQQYCLHLTIINVTRQRAQREQRSNSKLWQMPKEKIANACMSHLSLYKKNKSKTINCRRLPGASLTAMLLITQSSSRSHACKKNTSICVFSARECCMMGYKISLAFMLEVLEGFYWSTGKPLLCGYRGEVRYVNTSASG